jgi:hypothetical protein
MIDVHTEDLFVLAKGPPEPKPRRSAATYWRWALKGVQKNGQRHTLESLLYGGRRYSSRQALDRFLCALNAEEEGVQPPSKLRAQQQARAAERAAATFDRR